MRSREPGTGEKYSRTLSLSVRWENDYVNCTLKMNWMNFKILDFLNSDNIWKVKCMSFYFSSLDAISEKNFWHSWVLESRVKYLLFSLKYPSFFFHVSQCIYFSHELLYIVIFYLSRVVMLTILVYSQMIQFNINLISMFLKKYRLSYKRK